jgi:hypothetical protein
MDFLLNDTSDGAENTVEASRPTESTPNVTGNEGAPVDVEAVMKNSLIVEDASRT